MIGVVVVDIANRSHSLVVKAIPQDYARLNVQSLRIRSNSYYFSARVPNSGLHSYLMSSIL